MGSTCGIVKARDELDQVVIPIKAKKHLKFAPPPDEKEAQIGKYYAQAPVNKAHEKDWQKLLFAQESTILTVDAKLEKQLKIGVLRGIPSEFRWRTWTNIFLKQKCLTEEVYNLIDNKNCAYLDTIRRDLDRSFPKEPYFNKEKFGEVGQAALERILAKFSVKHKEIGYCQGMNFVAGFLLIVSGGSEIEVYCFLEALCKTMRLDGFFSEGMPYLKKCVWIAKQLIKEHNKKIYNHFEEQCIPDDLWLLKWLLTVFTMILSGPVLVRAWDFFLIRGFSTLYKIVLTILDIIEPEVLVLDTGGICEYLADIKTHVSNPDEFVKHLQGIKLSKSALDKLEKDYDSQEKNLVSPSKEKLTTQSEDNKLPPLKISPVRIKSTRPAIPYSTMNINTHSHLFLSKTPNFPNSLLSQSPCSPLAIKRTLSGSFTPTKKSTIPTLPDIRRSKNRKRTFGLTNNSCEVTMHIEHLLN